jgi:lactoylglutathione lyase
MIETGGMKRPERKSDSENPAMLRFNVADVSATAAVLAEKGVAVEVKIFDWGTVGSFIDPDGNACEFKNADDPFFDPSNS